MNQFKRVRHDILGFTLGLIYIVLIKEIKKHHRIKIIGTY